MIKFKKYIIGMMLWSMAQILYSQSTITIGKVMYQNQAFSTKDKQIFDADKEGSRVCYLWDEKNGSLWKSDEIRHKDVFKKYKLKKLTYDADRKLYPWLKSKMAKVPSGTVYNPDDFIKKIKVQKDGTLCLPLVDCTD